MALWDTSKGGGAGLLGSATETGGRNLRALVLIESVLKQAGLGPKEVESIAVGLGPGSYTGIRGAISVAQGWELAHQTKLVGISSVECLAAQAAREKMAGRVAILVDAQRNEFYLAIYEMLAGGARIVEPLRLVTFAEAKASIAGCGAWLGPEVDQYFPGGQAMFPRAEMLAELASSNAQFTPGEKLTPMYLRETSFVKAPPSRIIE